LRGVQIIIAAKNTVTAATFPYDAQCVAAVIDVPFSVRDRCRWHRIPLLYSVELRRQPHCALDS
jgi:hypothetical protein